VRTVHEKLKECKCVLCQQNLDKHVGEKSCQLCSFTEAAHLRTYEKRKEHQLRLMNGDGDDDFFFGNNNNQQRQLTIQRIRRQQQQSQMISLPTMHNIVYNETRSSSSCRSWHLGFDTMSEVQVLGEISRLPSSAYQACAHESHFSAIDVESAFRSAIGRLWIGTASGSICIFDCNYFASPADVRIHSRRSHPPAIQIAIKKASMIVEKKKNYFN
jgi:ribosomal protein L37E